MYNVYIYIYDIIFFLHTQLLFFLCRLSFPMGERFLLAKNDATVGVGKVSTY